MKTENLEERKGLYNIKMSNGETGKLYGDEVLSFAKHVAKIKKVILNSSTVEGALNFLSSLDSRNSYSRIA